ncbi:MAG: hypothetical protein HYW49_08665 [Deltaproteobacteria bacterium]|nr:hypothetical protein [Deltaproteobacteria bacterium]
MRSPNGAKPGMGEHIMFLGGESFDAARAGQKALQLDRLKRAGFRVPEGFVLEAAAGLPSACELEEAVARIGGFPVAVRSSGNLEDLDGASFAGQYVSYLDVSSVGDLLAKIEGCRASAFSDQVRAYLARQGLSAEASRLAVLVQKMVAASTAGVAFTIHPVTGREEHAYVECCRGLGEKLVSGHVSPSRYVLNLSDGAVVESEAGSEDARLCDAALSELARRCLEIQAHYGKPQDIEWAIDRSGVLWILQSRPVTAIRWRDDVDEFTNADFKDGGVSARVCTPMMFSLYRDAMSRSLPAYLAAIRLLPRDPSIYMRDTLSATRADESSGTRADEWIAPFYGRVYWNAAAVKRALFKVPGFSEERFDRDLGIQKNYGADGPRTVPVNLRTICGAIPVAIALASHYKRQLALAGSFGEAFAEEERAWRARIAAFGETPDTRFFEDFAGLTGDFYLRVETSYFNTIYDNSNAQSDFKNFLAAMDRAIGGETSAIRLMGGLSDVSHMEMQRGLLALYRVARVSGMSSGTRADEPSGTRADEPSAQWAQALKEFLKHNDAHGDAELELKTPRWGEEPSRVREIVQGWLDSKIVPADPDETARRQRGEFESEVQRVEDRIARRVLWRLRFRSSFHKHLKRVRRFLSARERMREYSTRTYYLVRLYVLEAGRRLAAIGLLSEADSVFMLQNGEVAEVYSGKLAGKELSEILRYRKLMYDGYRNFEAPNELGRGVEQRSEESCATTGDGKTVFTGLGCSVGVAVGTVRVIENLSEVGTLQAGEILVTKFTDPGWTPALGMVSGVVTEVGGLLSHAAVIGREYGIPAVLNLSGATRRLKTGDRVRVDGASGQVELLHG